MTGFKALKSKAFGRLATAVGRFIDQIEWRRHFFFFFLSLTTKSRARRIKEFRTELVSFLTNHTIEPNMFYLTKVFTFEKKGVAMNAQRAICEVEMN